MLEHAGISNQHDINKNLIASNPQSKSFRSKQIKSTDNEPFPFQNDVFEKLTILQKIQVFYHVGFEKFL
jgi:hypothetical protein